VKKIGKEILSYGVYILVILGIAYLILTYVGMRTEVNGDSMVPTLRNKEQLIVDKLSYQFRNPNRFDVVVFPYAYEKGVYYIKRVIGLPGETVQIMEDGTIMIDGVVLEESFGSEPILANNRGVAFEPILLGEDEYFVLGDNRNNSKDSRDAMVGNIKDEDILGRAWLRIWPLSKFGLLKHK
jgi:signal peptidase I